MGPTHDCQRQITGGLVYFCITVCRNLITKKTANGSEKYESQPAENRELVKHFRRFLTELNNGIAVDTRPVPVQQNCQFQAQANWKPFLFGIGVALLAFMVNTFIHQHLQNFD